MSESRPTPDRERGTAGCVAGIPGGAIVVGGGMVAALTYHAILNGGMGIAADMVLALQPIFAHMNAPANQ